SPGAVAQCDLDPFDPRVIDDHFGWSPLALAPAQSGGFLGGELFVAFHVNAEIGRFGTSEVGLGLGLGGGVGDGFTVGVGGGDAPGDPEPFSSPVVGGGPPTTRAK